jgi:hypothetical protein
MKKEEEEKRKEKKKKIWRYSKPGHFGGPLTSGALAKGLELN